MQEDQQTQPTQPTQRPVNNQPRKDGAVIAQRVIWYIAGFIVTLLTLRVILLLLSANQDNAFVGFIYAVSEFFAWPFFGIFSYQPAYGSFVFELSSVVAIVIYSLVAWGLAKAFTLTGRPQA